MTREPYRLFAILPMEISEAHATAQAKGYTREAATLDQMRREIDVKASWITIP